MNTPSNTNSFFSHWKQDLPAGLVVFLVALPLCLGIALASGAPMFSGIIAGIIGGVVITLASGSQLGVSGPAAGLVVIVLAGIETLGSFEAFLLAGMLAGLIQIGMGYAKAGFIAHYIPNSVIKGMLAAIGIIIILKQIPHAVGYDADFEGDLAFWQADGQNTLTELVNMMGFLNMGAVIISFVSLAILILWERPFMKNLQFTKFIPGPLFAVFFAVGANLFFSAFMPTFALSSNHLVSLPIPDGIGGIPNLFTLPDFTQLGNPLVYQIAFIIAIVASLETLLVSEATDKLDPYKRITPANRELKAQGIGNFVSGLIGGIPITQVIVRSSANIQSGGKTKASSFFHGLFLLVSVLLIPGILNLIPLASLAAILVMVGFKLAQPSLFKEKFKNGWDQFIPFVVTIVAILFTDLLMGVGIGLVVAIFYILRAHYRNAFSYREKELGDSAHIQLTLAEEVSFLNKAPLMEKLSTLPAGTHVEINANKTVHIDHDVVELIQNFRDNAKYKGIELTLLGFDKKNKNKSTHLPPDSSSEAMPEIGLPEVNQP